MIRISKVKHYVASIKVQGFNVKERVKLRFKGGFTLIELLVVVSIIAILAVVSFSLYSNATKTARDSVRLSDVGNIRKALQIYYSSVGKYPVADSEFISLEEDMDSNGPFASQMQGYLDPIPRDPQYGEVKDDGTPYSYQYRSTVNGEGYKIHAEKETSTAHEIFGGDGESLVYSSSEASPTPTIAPTPIPTSVPTVAPTPTPTAIPTIVPTPTSMPTPVPTSAPTPTATPVPRAGLSGDYFTNKLLTIPSAASRVDSTINFLWGNGSSGIIPNTDTFSVRWTGYITTPVGVNGTYTFYISADDGFRLYIDNLTTPLMNRWWNNGGAEYQASKVLAGGTRYNLKLEYYEDNLTSTIQLRWSGPGIAKQIIPSANLSY